MVDGPCHSREGDNLPEDLFFGRFRVLEKIGEGSTGEVFRAVDTARDSEIALKIVRPEIEERIGFARFRRQFYLMAQLAHPRILPMIDIGLDEDRMWFTSELIAGEDLSGLGLPVPPERASKLLLEIAVGLEFIHAHGILHLDLKPSNVFLSKEGIRLMDFGLANRSGGGICGTPAYMAPEIAARRSFDARADLYSLGVIALELISGENPLDKKTAAATIRAQIEYSPDVPPLGKRFEPLRALITKLLEKKPADRPPGAYSVKIALQDMLDIDRTPGEGFYLSQGAFVGRDNELRTISDVWQKIDAPQMFSITGERGVGRTAICERAILDIQLNAGSTTEIAGGRSTVVDLITPFRSKDFDGIMLKHLPPLLSTIGDELPEDYIGQLAIEAESPPENRAQFDAYATDLIEALTAETPIAVHVCKNADDSLWKALSESRARVLVLFDGVDGWPKIELSKFHRNEVEAYIGGIFGDVHGMKDLVDALMKRTGGNIYNIRKALRDFVLVAALEPSAEAWNFDPARIPGEIPFEKRWNTLPESAMLVASAVAVGGGLDSNIVEAIAEGDYFFAVFKLISEGMIGERASSGGVLYYPLPELERHIYGVLTSNRVKEVHRLLADRFLAASEIISNHISAASHIEMAGDEKRAFDIYFKTGTSALKKSDFRSAEKAFTAAERLISHSDDSKTTIRTLKRLALSRKYLGDFEGARESYYKASAFADKVENPEQKASILGDIGVTFFEEGNIPKALELYRRAREEHSKLESEKGELIDIVNMAGAYQVDGDSKSALGLYSEASPLAERLGNDLCRCAIALNTGALAIEDGDLGGALPLALDAATIARDHNLDHMLFESLLEIAAIHRQQGQVRFAMRSIEEAEQSVSAVGKRGIAMVALERAAILRSGGDYIAANVAIAQAGENYRHFGSTEMEAFFTETALLFAVAKIEPNIPKYATEPAQIKTFIGALRDAGFGREDAARKALQRILDKKLLTGEDVRAEATIAIARIAASNGEPQRAIGIIEKAESSSKMRDPFPRGRLLAEKGRILADEGESGAAKVALSGAMAIFKGLGNETELNRLSDSESRILVEEPHEIGLERLLPIIKALNSTLDSRELLGRILDAALDATGAERALLFLIRKGAAELEFARSADGKDIQVESAKFSHGLVEDVLETKQPRFSESVSDDKALSSRESVIDLDISMAICVPISGIEGDLRGLIYADARIGRGRFDDRTLEFLSALGDQAAVALRNAEIFDDLRSERDRMAVELAGEFGGEAIIGDSTKMKQLRVKLAVIAMQDISLLITGETGTGKDLVARTIHAESSRRDAPFVAINCAAIPENLLESELFGHERGAFTGADRKHIGKFELADRGTLFLDEIGEMPPALQAKLLRVIESRSFQRVGGDSEIEVDVRIVAATNIDPAEAIESGRLREDLYYRIAPIVVNIPPLRERREDVPALTARFIEDASSRFGREIKSASKAALSALMRYYWPGNIRELIGAIEEAVLFAPTNIVRVEDIPERITKFSFDPDKTGIPKNYDEYKNIKRDIGDRYERDILVKLLSSHEWNVTGAAKAFGIARSRLHQLIKKHKIVIKK